MRNKDIKKSWRNSYEKRQSLPSEWLQTDIYRTIYRDYAYPDHDIRFYRSPLEYDFLKSTLDSCMQLSANQNFDFGEDTFLEDDYLYPGIEDGKIIDDMNSYKSMNAPIDEIYGKAVALFDFIPEHENEFALVRGQQIWISYRHEQGWLVAVDPLTGDTGLVPEEYVRIYDSNNIFGYENIGRPISIEQSKESIMEDDSQKNETKNQNNFSENQNINNIIKNDTSMLNFQYSQLNLEDKDE
ncbi:unnamed protein product [Pneumocystis jirovecii]|uniref:SH3 domain-containing protein n=2 Tax=Pneumocystis jirovecii TaxID=42068 RepID=L0P9G3_PNEJI|nr:uncharacterized protein T551_00634 [Pneumocystis jirovecii RU7]KTW31951.1 hypothetical protein T551_00634 [Pneumocystis jirovecii RU7]CCJ28265.1 unnamed protein product [Pneumocystis jirovecii]